MLVLLRHAKAEPLQTIDHDRRLSERGRADAAAVREWLRAKGIRPDRVVVSTSARTRETWSLADPGGPEPVFDDRVYEASTDDLREVLAETSGDVTTLVVVGHNPGVEQLAWQLDDSDDARGVTNSGLSTSAVAVFAVSSWEDLSTAVLQEVAVPRGQV